MENHLDVHPDDFPVMLPTVGDVTGVYPKDHPENPSGEITLYQVTLQIQFPATEYVLPFVPAAPNLSGGAIDGEDPFLVGQSVLVNFIEGDPNRPFIQSRWFDGGATEIAQTLTEWPKWHKQINGVDFWVNKIGGVYAQLTGTQPLVVMDESSNVLLEVKYTGGAYEIHLGGDAGLAKLLDERAATAFNLHVHTSAAVGVPTSAPMTPPAVPMTWGAAHMTSVTKGK